MRTEEFEGLVGVDRMPGHQDSLRLLDHRSAPEGSLQIVILGESLQGDVDRTLQLIASGVDDVSEHASFGGLADVARILRREERDHGARCFTDDLRDQLECVLRAEPEPDERDVRPLPCRHGSDFLDVHLARDHVVAEIGHDLGEQRKPVAPFVRDQDAEVRPLVRHHLAQHSARGRHEVW
jgi:hypothetical protein